MPHLRFTFPHPIFTCFAIMLIGGCAAPAINPRQPASEDVVLKDVRQLTSGFARAGDARFSPDMRWIAFTAAIPGEAADQLFVAPLQRDEGEIVGIGRAIRISPSKSTNAGAAFGQDGLSIVLSSDAAQSKELAAERRLRLSRADGWEPAVTSADPGAVVDLTQHRISPDGAIDAQPTFSRDGKRIAFASQTGENIDLYIADPDGGNRARITDGPGFEGFPAFSPDGKRVAYCAAEPGSRVLDVYVCAIHPTDSNGMAAGTPVRLTENADVQRAPTWTPDGRQIIYSSARVDQPGHRLRAMRAGDGSMKTQVTLRGPADTAPALSPDGRYLLWTAKRTPDGSPQIFLARFTLPAGL